MKANELNKNEYAGFYENYISQVGTEYNLVEELEVSLHRFIHFVQNIPMDKHEFRYAEGKWTIKQIILHLMDAERIFAYRALRFARNDQTALPGFDENNYAEIAPAENRSIMSLLTEYSAIRHANLLMFKAFSNEELLRIGIASENQLSVRALGFVIVGHQNHHQRIFEERYL